MTEAYVLGGVRTPFTRYGGTLSGIRADDLLGMTMKGACDRLGVPLDEWKTSGGLREPCSRGHGRRRPVGSVGSGFPDTAAGATVNRFCGSSLSAAVTISHAIKAGDLGLGIACGVESMSRSGWALMKGDAAFSPQDPVLTCSTPCGAALEEPTSKTSSRVRDGVNRSSRLDTGRKPSRLRHSAIGSDV